ncbi:MAG: undecaprenyl-diphosphate phosphatase, partial [Deltaproteobacteria bacterium]
AWATLIGGILFITVEYGLRGRPSRDQVSWVAALAIGAAQLLAAVFPGTSRSGATILLGLCLGVSRPVATEFSFLLGIPTLLAAGLVQGHSALKDPTQHTDLAMLLLGSAVAATVAFAVVRWILGYVRKHDFVPFGLYRIALGLGMLLFVH